MLVGAAVTVVLKFIVVVTMALCCGCASDKALRPAEVGTSDNGLSSTEASQLAIKLANDECHRLFGYRPFQWPYVPAPKRMGSQWHWVALAGWGHSDVQAEVTFDATGEGPRVVARMLTSFRYPSPPFDPDELTPIEQQ